MSHVSLTHISLLQTSFILIIILIFLNLYRIILTDIYDVILVTQKSSQSEAKTSFGAGVVPIPIGSNVAISAKEKQIKRPKKDSVLVKHKKWLSDLQKTKERLEEQYIDDLRKKEEEKLKVSLSPSCCMTVTH